MDDWKNHPIVLYDGPCTLCNKSVQWIYRRDRQGIFRFAALEGPWAKSHVPAEFQEVNSVLLYDRGQWKTKSSAIIGILGRLSFPWNLLQVGWLIPKFIRDFMYENCARRRYLLFGTGYCAMVPKDRLLDA